MVKERHHYIPRFYLKNFACDEEKKFLYVYEYKGKIFKSSISDIGVKKGFYTFINKFTKQKTSIVEDFFASIENKTAPILDRIIRNEKINIDSKEKELLSLFMSILVIRTPRFASISENFEIETMKNVAKIIAQDRRAFFSFVKKYWKQDVKDDEIEQLRKSFLEKDKKLVITIKNGKTYFFKRGMEMVLLLTDTFLNSKRWHLLINNTSYPFITSDNPIAIQKVKHLPEIMNKGFGYGTIIFPISPKLCLLLRNQPFKKDIIEINNTDHVEKINHSIMILSHKFIFSNINSLKIKELYDSIPIESRQLVKGNIFANRFIITTINPVIDEEIDFDQPCPRNEKK
jgi:hypothetical protein